MKKLTKQERIHIQQEVERLKRHEKEQYEFIRNHEAPVTRRDFLGLGLLTGTGLVFSAPILDVFASKVYAAGCEGTGGSGGLAGFIQMELAGGSNLHSSIIPLTPSGDLLSPEGYVKFGYSETTSPIKPENIDIGLGFRIQPQSSFAIGIRSVITEEMEQYIFGLPIACRCENDTSRNLYGMTQLIASAQGPGQLTNIVGSNSSANGLRSRSSGGDLTTASRLTNAAATANLVNLGPILERLGEKDAKKILEAAKLTSERKLASFHKKDVSEQLATIIKCGYGDAIESVFKNTAEALNPNNDPEISGINGISERDSAIIKTVLDGNAVAGAMVDGGYDYHNGRATGRGSGTQKRFEAGQRLGRILRGAFNKGKDITVFLSSDGSASCTASAPTNNINGVTGEGFYANRREDASTSGHLLIHGSFGSKKTRNYDPMKAQLGGYNSKGSIALDANIVSNDPVAMTVAVLINHLSVQGQDISVSKIKSICSKAGVANVFDTQAKINSVKIWS